jgi:hypothetical protein
MKRDFGGVIWTNHAIQRLGERGVSQSDAWATFRRPSQSRYAKTKKAWIFYKTYGDQKIEVVAKKNEKGKWLILSVWSRPAYGLPRKKVEPLYKLLFRKIFKK